MTIRFEFWPALAFVVAMVSSFIHRIDSIPYRPSIRARSEAALLRETFGEEFENYARKVPAVIPYVI